MWFEDLMGFREESPEFVRANTVVEGETLRSKVNGRVCTWGRLETPTLAELRLRAQRTGLIGRGRLGLRETVADVQALHRDSANAQALFQVASQFNLLEMVAPSVTPEAGVDGYELDRTQGPACAIAAGAGTIFRNYFVHVNGRRGQTTDNQIDCLSDLGKALGNHRERLWVMRNGYALPSDVGLREIATRLAAFSERERDVLRGHLRIGLQWDTQVTLGAAEHVVSQAYCSALPVAYTAHAPELWRDFAGLVLEAAYEATLCAAVLNQAERGSNQVYLTLLGGGAFGNQEDWIFGAIERATRRLKSTGLDVAIVSYGTSHPRVVDFVGQAGSA
jgi:hypothetical protein